MKLGAVLIFIFSLCFPIVKLTSLMIIYFLPGHNKCIEIYLHILNQIGRYSLVDLDVALALVILSYDQRGALDTQVYAGLPIYSVAISINMLCSEAMLNMKKTVIPIY